MTDRVPADYRPASDLLAGRAILVTGAGQGLGRAVALAAAAHGAAVALLGRRQEKLEATYDAITAAGGAEPAIVPLDLAKVGNPELEQLPHLLRRAFGRLDGIAHCASHFTPLRPLADQSIDDWLDMLRVNVAAPAALTRACLPLLGASPGSSVVFTGETHGVRPRAFWGAFAVSKAALSPLAAIWADELERPGHPRVNVLVPGPVASPQRARSHPGEERSSLRTVEDAARAYLYLLGADSAAVSGRTLEI